MDFNSLIFEKSIPAINRIEKNMTFDKWIKLGSGNMFSILILDVSGSMNHYYQRLINMANEIITNQMKSHQKPKKITLTSSNY